MSRRALARLRRAMFIISAGAFAWSAVLVLTGGFYFRIGGWPISSRDPEGALVTALLAAAAGIGLTWHLDGPHVLRDKLVWLMRLIARTGRHTASSTNAWRRSLSVRVVAALRARREPWLASAPAFAVAIGGISLAILQWADARPLWLDEEMIVLNVRDRSWSDLGGALWLGQSSPLGWLVLERVALVTLGAGELALRLVPVLFGIGTIITSLWIGHRWMTTIGSAALVLLCAFGPFVSHYLFEAKHYSADTFFALFLPALAVWAIGGDDAQARARRSLAWWAAAAAGQMLANGALLVTPGCALLLALAAWRRDGRGAALRVATAGILWLAAFGFHYVVALRFTHESDYLRNYWASEFPAASMGVVDRARWIVGQFEALAANPGGTEWWVSLWVCAVLGLAFGRRSKLGLAFATVPLASFVLAGLRLVPLHERFSLWIVPALYVGVALAMDGAAGAIRWAYRHRRWSSAIVAPLLVGGGAVSGDIYLRGNREIRIARPPHDKHALNDRAAVRWLMTHLQPGDAIMTTRLGWPAVWWYGDISIANAGDDGIVRHPRGVALLEVKHAEPEPQCGLDSLREDLQPYRRVLVYVGFRDVPPGFDYLLLHTLDRIGTIEDFSRYSRLGLAVVFDLRDSAAGGLAPHLVRPTTDEERVPLEGCLRVGPARRW